MNRSGRSIGERGSVTIFSSSRPEEFQFALAMSGAHSAGVMSDRELVLDAVRELPDNLSLREIVDELLLMKTVRERLARNPEGKGIPAEQLLGQVSSWAIK
jgi:hypothetical protein